MSLLFSIVSGVAGGIFRMARNSGDADGAANESSIKLTDSQPASAGSARTEAAGGSFAQNFRAHLAKVTDSNGDGVISRDELAQQLTRGGVSGAAADRQYQAMDRNGDGQVTVDEFTAATPMHPSPLVQHVMQLIEARRAAADGAAGSAFSTGKT
jgi:hypothetical protein